jgi:hypothetical protein
MIDPAVSKRLHARSSSNVTARSNLHGFTLSRRKRPHALATDARWAEQSPGKEYFIVPVWRAIDAIPDRPFSSSLGGSTVQTTMHDARWLGHIKSTARRWPGRKSHPPLKTAEERLCAFFPITTWRALRCASFVHRVVSQPVLSPTTMAIWLRSTGARRLIRWVMETTSINCTPEIDLFLRPERRHNRAEDCCAAAFQCNLCRRWVKSCRGTRAHARDA